MYKQVLQSEMSARRARINARKQGGKFYDPKIPSEFQELHLPKTDNPAYFGLKEGKVSPEVEEMYASISDRYNERFVGTSAHANGGITTTTYSAPKVSIEQTPGIFKKVYDTVSNWLVENPGKVAATSVAVTTGAMAITHSLIDDQGGHETD